ncbi:hypothetical protein Anas_05226 [Armadillidium nasatum]|uniref:Uncharacterized protein n=1 Tax=Armadillidium nasatum TaxID=96803 RepID=A0A5N5SNZ8_9CRUS|nr:hypothetical protein Anas_05226 [Armadillidium nasatum]
MVLTPRSRRTLSGWGAIGCCVLAGILISFAMFTRNWLEAESKAYGTAMQKIGLWVQCFRSLGLQDENMQTTFFTGCRWIFNPFTTSYDEVRAMVLTPFFVTVQVFFTFCFTFTLIGFVMVGILVFCPGEDFEPIILKIAYIVCFAGGVCGFIAVIIFGVREETIGIGCLIGSITIYLGLLV